MKAPVPADCVTLAEIAEGLGVSKQLVAKRASKEAWPFQEVAGLGGKKRLYPLASLPKPVCEACQRAQVKKSMALAPADVTPARTLPAKRAAHPVALRAPISPEVADAQQLIVQEARLCILTAIEKAAAESRISIARSIGYWLQALADGSMPFQQRLWCALANNKNGFQWSVSFTTGRPVAVASEGQDVDEFAARLTKRSMQRWIAERAAGGDVALIPGKRLKDMSVPPWAGAFLSEMQRPQKPTLQSAFDAMARRLQGEGWTPHRGAGLPKPMEYPDYGSVCRWYREKYSQLDKQKGRNTGSALNPHKFHHVRTTDGMSPLQEVHSDGWATKFYAPHPISGKWVTGEVWHSHDVATRKAYVHERSIGLSENTAVIAGSLYAVAVEDGEPLFWQTDNTGAIKNDRMEFDPVASMAHRRSIQIVHNIPGNSQANGIAESFNKYLQERSKELATYKGPGMDSRTQIRVHKLTNKIVKAADSGNALEVARIRAEAEKKGCGLVFGAWAEAVDWVIKVVREFNDMPHRGLPKITDASGKRRHMTPNERMAEFIASGWTPAPLSGEELIDAFRVHEVKRVTRGCVTIMGQKYHHAELDHLNGEDVLIAYDIEDGNQVYVKNMAGAYLYTAKFYASRSYRAQSFVDIAMERRVSKQIGRLGKKVSAIEAQRPGGMVDINNLRANQIVIGGRVIEHETISSSASVFETPAVPAIATKADEMPKRAAEVVQSVPTVPRSERSADDNYAEWSLIGDRLAYGESVSDLDRRFYEKWPTATSQGRAWFKQHPETKRKAAA